VQTHKLDIKNNGGEFVGSMIPPAVSKLLEVASGALRKRKRRLRRSEPARNGNG
jgi:hypothetical protein